MSTHAIGLTLAACCVLTHPVQAYQPPPSPCAGAPSPAGNVRRLLPRDEAAMREDFAQFRQTLLRAVARKDSAAVLAVVHPRARVSFDGSGGPDAFRRYHLDATDEDFWTEFAAILRMGGRFRTPTEFDAPYTFADWPERADAFECLAVIGMNVRLRERPDAGARILALLHYDIVERVIETRPVPGWQQVTTTGGRAGFVASRYLRSPIDHRAMFAFQDGRWWLMAYLAGD